IATYAQDLEGRWQHEAARPRLTLGGADLLLDAIVTVGADAPTVWNHMTSPALRARWEGGIVLDESPAGGRMGVGTTLQCVTGRLASIEEIVDWQPFEHVGYRVVVPDVGLIQATYDLEGVRGGRCDTAGRRTGRSIGQARSPVQRPDGQPSSGWP